MTRTNTRDATTTIRSLVERIDGAPFAADEGPHADSFHFDTLMRDCAENRVVFACVTCDAGVVLLGVTQCGTVTCRRCNRQMLQARTRSE